MNRDYKFRGLMVWALASVFCSPIFSFPLESPETQIPLVELFSSEGCSSCPPAEAWLGALRKDPALWKQFVPIEFHVHYWDRLGWKDPYAKEEYTKRQKNYAETWKTKASAEGQVYTPEFVLNGAEWRPGREGSRAVPRKAGARVGILSVAKTGNYTFEVNFHPVENDATWDVSAAILGNGFVSHVRSGENRDSTLHHEFVVLQLKSPQALKKGANGFSTELTFSSTGDPKAESYSLAVWVTKTGQFLPVQAVGGDIAP